MCSQRFCWLTSEQTAEMFCTKHVSSMSCSFSPVYHKSTAISSLRKSNVTEKKPQLLTCGLGTKHASLLLCLSLLSTCYADWHFQMQYKGISCAFCCLTKKWRRSLYVLLCAFLSDRRSKVLWGSSFAASGNTCQCAPYDEPTFLSKCR